MIRKAEREKIDWAERTNRCIAWLAELEEEGQYAFVSSILREAGVTDARVSGALAGLILGPRSSMSFAIAMWDAIVKLDLTEQLIPEHILNGEPPCAPPDA